MDTIINQVVDLVKYKTTSFINTGDKVFDNGLNLICMATLSSSGYYLQQGTKRIRDYFLDKNSNKENDYDDDDDDEIMRLRKKIKKNTELKNGLIDTIEWNSLYKDSNEPEITEKTNTSNNTLSYKIRSLIGCTKWKRVSRTNNNNNEANRDNLLKQFRSVIRFDRREMIQFFADWVMKTYPDITFNDDRDIEINLQKFSDFQCTKFIESNRLYNQWWMIPVWVHENYLVYAHSVSDGELCFLSDSFTAVRMFTLHLDKLLNEKKATNLTETNGKKQHYSFDLMDWYLYQNGSTRSIYESFAISTAWTLENMVFKQKPMIISYLNYFQQSLKGACPYDSRKAGFILAGKPGCGKTLFVTALANYLGYNVANISLTKINDRALFRKAIHFATENKVILFFDEFDHLIESMQSKNNAEERMIEHDTQLKDLETKMNKMKELEENDAYEAMKTKYLKQMQSNASEPIDLAFLLSELDGVSQAVGRVIVATTNYPERIEPALLRPGRFDFKIQLDHFDDEHIKQLLIKMYNPIGEDFTWLEQISFPDYVWSPAEITLQHQTHRNFRSTAEYLLNNKPGQFV